MNSKIAVFLLLSIVLGAAFSSVLNADNDWIAYKVKYSKSYKNAEDEQLHYQTWKLNLKHIEEHNQKKSSYKLAVNAFTDRTAEDIRGIRKPLPQGHGGRVQVSNSCGKDVKVAVTPDAIDWRDQGAVTPVRDQGQSGQSWTISAVGAIEGVSSTHGFGLNALSDQQLLDCCAAFMGGPYVNYVDGAFDCVKNMSGIDTLASYPDTQDIETCHYNEAGRAGKVSGIVNIIPGDEDDLKYHVGNKGPVSVAIDASQTSFQQYISGVYDDSACQKDSPDHLVLVVGYGTVNETGVDYWIVKNSWGPNWGEDGYIRIARNTGNLCGIANNGSMPFVYC